MLIMKHRDLEKFTKSDSLREHLLSATDYELSVIELALKYFGARETDVSGDEEQVNMDRNNKVTALATLKSVEEARKRWQDSSFFAVENTTSEAAKLLSNEKKKGGNHAVNEIN